VFKPTLRPVDLRDFRNWWAWVPGSCWRHPEGPGSTLHGRERHPVTQVSYDDAVAYAAWAGKELPSEGEWERAARGGFDQAVYSWGDEFAPKDRMMANTWQGQFPWQNLLIDGYARTSPVTAFPPNDYGLYDMTGNVWEWTSDWYDSGPGGGCCGPESTREPSSNDMQGRPLGYRPRRVIKGGSHLCAPNYCLRYRPAARQAQSVDTSTGHIGFRCIIRPLVGT
jgi:formylglycine-generating enzyme required for sulfatase activity